MRSRGFTRDGRSWVNWRARVNRRAGADGPSKHRPRGIVCAHAFGAAPPLSRGGEQIVRSDFDFDWRLRPRFVPHSEKTAAPSLAGKGRVTFEQELGQRISFAWMKAEVEIARDIRSRPSFAVTAPSISPLSWRVGVSEVAEPVRQTEGPRPQADAQRIGKPFRQEENARLAGMPDVGANVEEFVRGDRLEEPFAKPSADPRPHSQQGERDDADKRAPVMEVELEGNLPLQGERGPPRSG